ncbi:hypothetical protein NB717_002352 [Xanthomonas sacchari]|nr:hypothetical protein [Xanthomonas sacchari]
MLITLDRSALAPAALSTTLLPRMVPLCASSAFSASWATASDSRPSLPKSTATRSPAARPTWPAAMLPVLLTAGASNATTPPLARIAPSLRTAPAAPLATKRACPPRKSLSLMPSELTSSPPTSTCAPLPKYTPLGLTSQTWPLPLSSPSTWLGVPPSTRFSAMAVLSGCSKRTLAWLPMSKLFQFRISRWLS